MMKYLLMLFLSLGAYAQQDQDMMIPDRPECPENFQLIAIEGSEYLTMRYGDQSYRLYHVTPGKYSEYNDQVQLFANARFNGVLMPRFEVARVPETEIFRVAYTTHDGSGVCIIDSVNEEEL